MKHWKRTTSLVVETGELLILPRGLSQMVNEKLNMNFSECISRCRVVEARKLLAISNSRYRKRIAFAFKTHRHDPLPGPEFHLEDR